MQNGQLIQTLRIKKSLTQKDLANLLKIKLGTYKMYENNLRVMKLYELNFISNYFNVSLDSLLSLKHNHYISNVSERINYRFLKFKLKLIRKNNHLTQKDLAKEFKIAVNSISKFENKPQFISLNYLYLFAKKFNVSVDYICGKNTKKEIFNLT